MAVNLAKTPQRLAIDLTRPEPGIAVDEFVPAEEQWRIFAARGEKPWFPTDEW